MELLLVLIALTVIGAFVAAAKAARVPRFPSKKRRMKVARVKDAAEKLRTAYHLRRIHALFTKEGWTVRYRKINGQKAFAEEHGVSVKTVGYVNDEELVLYVDHRFDVLSTIVHEGIHVLYPDLPERKVVHLEKLIMKHMTPYQARLLHMLVANYLS